MSPDLRSGASASFPLGSTPSHSESPAHRSGVSVDVQSGNACDRSANGWTHAFCTQLAHVRTQLARLRVAQVPTEDGCPHNEAAHTMLPTQRLRPPGKDLRQRPETEDVGAAEGGSGRCCCFVCAAKEAGQEEFLALADGIDIAILCGTRRAIKRGVEEEQRTPLRRSRRTCRTDAKMLSHPCPPG